MVTCGVDGISQLSLIEATVEPQLKPVRNIEPVENDANYYFFEERLGIAERTLIWR